MQKLILVFLILFISSIVFGSQKVLILHGWGCPKIMMNKITRTVHCAHFNTENYGYKSMSEDLDSLGKELYLYIRNDNYDTISFVTHSMGALVVRSMFNYTQRDHDFPIIYRIVMIAPPNNGAELADIGTSLKMLRFLMGPNVDKLKTGSSSYANHLPVPTHSEIGIIFGYHGNGHGFNPLIKGDNDGLLTPQCTSLGNEKDIAAVKVNHAMIHHNKKVCKMVVAFLKNGRFL
jgi:triacylglycerol lipase